MFSKASIVVPYGHIVSYLLWLQHFLNNFYVAFQKPSHYNFWLACQSRFMSFPYLITLFLFFSFLFLLKFSLSATCFNNWNYFCTCNGRLRFSSLDNYKKKLNLNYCTYLTNIIILAQQGVNRGIGISNYLGQKKIFLILG